RRSARPTAGQPAGGDRRHDARGAQRVREFLARGRSARRCAAGADRRHQRLPAHRRRLAHDRAPRLARAGPACAGGAGGAAQHPAQDAALIGHLQTIAATLLPSPPATLQRSRWDTPDGDFIDVDFAGDARSRRLMVLFHGLEGSSDSHYARQLARALPEAGWRVAIPHWRGCSGEPNRKPRAYHSGDTAEVDWILRRYRGNSGRPVDAIGISLGGNALLKWLGERGTAAGEVVRRAAAVSAPLDLPACGVALDRGLNRLLYTRMFLATL